MTIESRVTSLAFEKITPSQLSIGEAYFTKSVYFSYRNALTAVRSEASAFASANAEASTTVRSAASAAAKAVVTAMASARANVRAQASAAASAATQAAASVKVGTLISCNSIQSFYTSTKFLRGYIFTEIVYLSVCVCFGVFLWVRHIF